MRNQIQEELERIGSTGVREPEMEPHVSAEITRIVFPWCATDTHHVTVTAEITGAGPDRLRIVTIYDTFPGRYKPLQPMEHLLPQFLDLLGQYHPPFAGPVGTRIQHGDVLHQDGNDCGLITVDSSRRLALRGAPLETHPDPASWERTLRASFIRGLGWQCSAQMQA